MTRTGLKVNGNILLLVRITVPLSFWKIQLGRWEGLQPRETPPRPAGGTGTASAQGHVWSSQRAKRLCPGGESPHRGRGFRAAGRGGVGGADPQLSRGLSPFPDGAAAASAGREHRAAPGRAAGELPPSPQGSPAAPGPFACTNAAAVESVFPPSHYITTFSSLQDERRQLF